MKHLRSLSVILLLALIISCVPLTASAEQMKFTPPTEAMEIDKNVITMAAHSQGWVTPEVLGINNVTSRSMEVPDAFTNGFSEDTFNKASGKVCLGVFGSDINSNPNPYMYNYYYNCFAKEEDRTEFGTYTLSKDVGGGPMHAAASGGYDDGNGNTICASLFLRPDILLGIGPVKTNTDGSITTGYTNAINALPENNDEDETNNYNPYEVNYTTTRVYNFLNCMYELSDICNEISERTGKTTRYDNPYIITSNLEKYVKGIQAYVIKQIKENNLSLDTVAVVDARVTTYLRSIDALASNEYALNSIDNNTGGNTASYSRVAEFVQDTTNNLTDVLKLEKKTGNVASGKQGEYYVATADQIAENCDIIMTADAIVAGSESGALNSATLQSDVISGCTTDALANRAKNEIQCMAYQFECVGSIGVNSVENLLGMAYYTAYLYPEYFNQFEVAAYWYQNFYHISDNAALKSAMLANFKGASVQKEYADKYTCDISGYNDAAIKNLESKIIAGMKYYEKNKAEFKDCLLYQNGVTGEMNGWVIDWTKGIGSDDDTITVEKDADGNWYAYQYGNKLKDSEGWLQIDSDYYYIDNSGLASTGWVQVSGKWYYFGSNAKMITGWAQINGKWYYMNKWGAMVTGWAQISGKWYYFNNSGAMVTGWAQISGKWYYFNNSGAMVTGWASVGGKWYYFNNSGAMVTGWAQISGKWYYFNNSGAMVTGWASVGGKWYYFNNSGAMVTGWRQIGGKWYYFNGSGAMLTGTQRIGGRTYRFNSSGVWVA